MADPALIARVLCDAEELCKAARFSCGRPGFFFSFLAQGGATLDSRVDHFCNDTGEYGRVGQCLIISDGVVARYPVVEKIDPSAASYVDLPSDIKFISLREVIFDSAKVRA